MRRPATEARGLGTVADFAPGLENAFSEAVAEGAVDLRIEGVLPPGLDGTLYLNGPGTFAAGSVTYRHWLDGDGMVVRLRLGALGQGVRAEACCRFVASEKRRSEKAGGRAVYRTFGTRFADDRLHYGVGLASPVNVSVALWNGRLMAFGEQGLPYELDPQTLETLGAWTFDRKLSAVSPFSAHPKIDPLTGVFYNFGVSFATQPSLSFYGFAPGGSAPIRQRIPLPYAASIHDFAISKRWAVFFVSPYILDVDALRHRGQTLLDSLHWRPQESAWWIVLDRASGEEAGRWPVAASHCLHLINASDRDDGGLVVDLVELDEPAYPHYLLPDLYRYVPAGRPVRWTLDPVRGPLSSRVLEGPPSPDFPVVPPSRLGRSTDSAWMLGIRASGQPGRKFFDVLARVDLEAGQVASLWSPPQGRYFAGEPAVAELAGGGVALLAPLWGPESGSEVVVFEGMDLEPGPVARVVLARPMPLAFHSTFEASASKWDGGRSDNQSLTSKTTGRAHLMTANEPGGRVDLAPDLLNRKSARFFFAATAYPKTTILLFLLLTGLFASFLPRLSQETSSDAFLHEHHPSIVARDRVTEIFGLSDPVVVAIVDEINPNGIFTPQALAMVSELTRRVSQVEGIDPDRVTSLATESDIVGTQEGMLVRPFFDSPPKTLAEAQAIRQAVMDFPLYAGSLVARDGSATLIVAELLQGQETGAYDRLVEAVGSGDPASTLEVHVAGEGAATEFLGTYIDRDARLLNPVASVIVSLILLVAYRTVRGVLLPNIVVMVAAVAALGSMAAAGVPFYIITSALPVLLIGIAVADTIHILGQYYEEVALRPQATSRELAVRSVVAMWRPVLITSVTDAAGLLALSSTSTMPPMRAFGVYATVGIVFALFASLFLVPNLLVLLKPMGSRAIKAPLVPLVSKGELVVDGFGRALGALGGFVVRRPHAVLALMALITLAGIVGLVRLEVNEERISNFKSDEPIYLADRAINRTLDGTNYLDVMVETDAPDALLEPKNLRRIESLQRFLESQPHVGGTTSVVDYLKQMNRAVNEDREQSHTLPQDPNLVAQYFVLYSASGDPTAFEEEIDYDYRLANVRARLDTGRHSHTKPVVLATERYLSEDFNAAGITGHLAGRVNVDYHWIHQLGATHFQGLALALLAVWLAAAACFRSLVGGLFCVVPVALAVMLIYAVMGFSGIWLAVGTSMFAAIAIGTAVDFAIHTMDRLRVLIQRGKELDQAFAELYSLTGRALLFNFSAVFLGFGVLCASSVPPLIRFGALVGVAVSASFLASLTVLPALICLVRPAFLGLAKPQAAGHPQPATAGPGIARLIGDE